MPKERHLTEEEMNQAMNDADRQFDEWQDEQLMNGH